MAKLLSDRAAVSRLRQAIGDPGQAWLLPFIATAVISPASPVVTIGCNVLRILPTAWFYGYADPDFALQFHNWAGWAMVPVAFVIGSHPIDHLAAVMRLPSDDLALMSSLRGAPRFRRKR